jgi:hypothetical protein
MNLTSTFNKWVNRWREAGQKKKEEWEAQREVNKKRNMKLRSRQVCRAIARREEFILVSGHLDEPRKSRRKIALNRARRDWRETSAAFFSKVGRVRRSKRAVVAAEAAEAGAGA